MRAPTRRAVEAGLLVLALALLTTRGLDTADAAVHLDTALAIVTRGEATLSIDPGALWVPSRPIAGGLFYQADDGLRSASSPGLAWIAVPFVALGRGAAPRLDPLFEGGDPRDVVGPLQRDARVIAFVCIFALSAALSALFLALAASELALSRSATLASVAALALGSPRLAYAGAPWTQLPTCAALSFIVYRLAARASRPDAGVGSLGIAGAIAILVRLDHVVFVALAMIALFRIDRARHRSPLSLARALVPMAAALSLRALWGLPERGDGWSLAELPRGLLGLTLSPRTGLLVYAPFVVLVPLGIARLRARSAPIAMLVIAWLAAALLTYAGWFDWGASLAYGPRFLVPILPALALAFGAAFDALDARGRALALALVGLGFAVELPGALLSHARIDEPDRLLYPTFVTAWRELFAGRSLSSLGVDCAAGYAIAYPALAAAVAALGFVLSARPPSARPGD